jgi:hypothetical protein
MVLGLKKTAKWWESRLRNSLLTPELHFSNWPKQGFERLFPELNRKPSDAVLKTLSRLNIRSERAAIAAWEQSGRDRRPVTSEVAGSSPVVPAIPFQRFPSLFKYLLR